MQYALPTGAFLFLLSAPLLWAAEPEHTLRLEHAPFKNTSLHCENKARIKPAKNDFELVDYSFMSSEAGERFALVTLKNPSAGVRILNHEHIVVTFGDCSFTHPQPLEEKFSGGEVRSLTMNLGFKRFPALQLNLQPQ